MDEAIMKRLNDDKEQEVTQKLERFSQELGVLLRRYGLGIADNAELFVLEGREDYTLEYKVDRNSRICLR